MDRQIGAQYYTLRDFATTIEDFDETCRKVKEIGYKLVQISGTPLAAADMKPILDKYGLKVVVTHKSLGDFLDNIDEVIEYNKTLGCELCGLGWVPMECRESGEALNKLIQDLNMIGKKISEAGLYFGYHNHAFEFAKVDGKRMMDRLIAETDPETVYFIVDTHWVQVAGLNAAEQIRGMGKRAMAIHFKDLKANADNSTEMCEIGEGNLDWDEIIKACDEAGARWALVEQDECKRSPFESLKMSYDYLVTKGFH